MRNVLLQNALAFWHNRLLCEMSWHLIDGGRRQVDLAHGHTEDPIALHWRHDEKGDPDEEDLVGQGQHEDVNVGDGLHLWVPQHDVDDEGVAAEANDANDGIEDLKRTKVLNIIYCQQESHP